MRSSEGVSGGRMLPPVLQEYFYSKLPLGPIQLANSLFAPALGSVTCLERKATETRSQLPESPPNWSEPVAERR